MGRNRIIGPAAGEIHRAMLDGQDVRDAAAYQAMLKQDLGRTSFGDGRWVPPRETHPLLRPVGLFCLALTALFFVGVARMWQMGVFAPMFDERVPVAALKPTWAADAQKPARADEQAAPPLASLIPEPPKPAPQDAGDDEGSDDSSDGAE